MLSFPELKYEAAMQGHVSRVTCLAQTADRGTLASGSMDAVACVWDMEERICTRTLYDIHHAIRALGYEGRRAFEGGDYLRLCLWSDR